jgi:lycopene beta-cyclase
MLTKQLFRYYFFTVYAMPLKDNQIFFEETSLVARPGVSLEECKERCFARLEYHGIKVTKILEEEFCYIPMGGALPIRDQRTIGLGGASVMVHPSTGYHLCRCLMGATAMAAAIQNEMSASTQPNLDQVAASAYHALWTPENIRQRNFAVFGGEFLMKQDVVGLRGFFDGFFKLPLPLWAGFLAGWPGLPFNENHESWLARLWFGLNFIVRIPLPVALDMAASIAAYTITEGVPLPQSVTPFLGEPDSYEYERNTDTIGDVAVKAEARQMIAKSAVTKDVPVAFTSESEAVRDTPAVTITAKSPEKEAAKV